MPLPTETIAAGWTSYERDVVPSDAGPSQRIETRRAFYAGAWILMQIMMRVGEDDVTEDAGVATLERITAEIEAFYRNVGKGGR